MDEHWFCVRCRDADLQRARQAMVRDRAPARQQAEVMRAVRDLTGGWREQRCQHPQAVQQAMTADQHAANFGEPLQPSRPREPLASETLDFGAVAERLGPLCREPYHADAARAFEARKAESEARMVEFHKQMAASARADRNHRSAERTRQYRAKMQAAGLVEKRLQPGRRCTREDWLDHVAYKIPDLPYEAVANFGVRAVTYAMEALAIQKHPRPALYMLRYARRVHDGLIRVWVTPQEAQANPQGVIDPDEERDAYVEFDGGPANSLDPYDGGPSEKWAQRQTNQSDRYADARRARGLTLAVKGMPQVDNRS